MADALSKSTATVTFFYFCFLSRFHITDLEALSLTEWSDWSDCGEEGIQSRTRVCTGQCENIGSSDLIMTKTCDPNSK